jgi:hypothetical protein
VEPWREMFCQIQCSLQLVSKEFDSKFKNKEDTPGGVHGNEWIYRYE